MSRALVLGPGGLRSAYSGGVVATIGRKLGCNYFDALYTCSAGSYTASYLASGQPDMIEAIWRECVHGNLLMRWCNTFRSNQPVLDLFYLNSVLADWKYRLAVEDLLCAPTKLVIVATECESGSAHYFSPTTHQEFFLQVRASAAVPYLHPKVQIGAKEYVDGMLSDPLPIARAIADGHDEILVVCNKSRLTINRLDLALSALCAMKFRGRKQILRSLVKLAQIDDLVTSKVRVILPSTEPPVRWYFDSARDRINQLVDLGIRDALAFLT